MARSLSIDIPNADTSQGLAVYVTRGLSQGLTLGFQFNQGQYKMLVAFAPGAWSSPIDVLAAWDGRYSTPFVAADAIWFALKYISPDGFASEVFNNKGVAT